MNRYAGMLLSLAMGLSLTPQGFAQGGLLVTPTRVVFEGRMRTETLTLVNRSNTAKSFRLFITEKKMGEDGVLMDISEAESKCSARNLVRFSPRRVTLAPGQSQKVRLLLRAPADLDEGEYRSHLVLQALPDPSSTSPPSSGEVSGHVGIELTPLIGASIPIIVRRGELVASVGIADAHYTAMTTDSPATLGVLVQRQGTRSVYGNITVAWEPESGMPLEIGHVVGMAIYPELSQRWLRITLTPPPNVAMKKGQFLLRYYHPDTPNAPMAEVRIPLL